MKMVNSSTKKPCTQILSPPYKNVNKKIQNSQNPIFTSQHCFTPLTCILRMATLHRLHYNSGDMQRIKLMHSSIVFPLILTRSVRRKSVKKQRTQLYVMLPRKYL